MNSAAPLQTQDALIEAQPPLPVRRLHNFIYCPRLFYYQWVENLFEENADTVAGSHVHRNVDKASSFDDQKQAAMGEGLPEGARLKSLKMESAVLGLVGSSIWWKAGRMARRWWITRRGRHVAGPTGTVWPRKQMRCR